MRRLLHGALAAALTIAALAGTPAPAAAANGNAQPKVVLVVGATHGTTSTYRTWMNEVYAEAKRYTTNVVKVYSPNATWDAIKKAAQGANILVYMGHGNGFPSPYRSTIYPQTQNGFGANETAGNGDHNVKYYGEYYIAREIKLAPNAVVLLSHLCYASGNSEPGKPDSTLPQAKQRMDNYAAGFIGAGARAVIADGHMDPAWYIGQLFTTHKSVDTIFRGHPAAKGSVYSFASTRSPGYTAFYDPDSDDPVRGFYRSMVSVPGVSADDVTGAGSAPSDTDPVSFSVPGAAEVTAEQAGLFADPDLAPDAATGAAPASLPAGTKLRLEAEETNAAGGRVLQVRTFDGDTAGWMSADDLAPRDSTAPKIGRFAATPSVLSPVISGSRAIIAAEATETVTWKMTITDGDETVLASITKSGRDIVTSWDGRSNGEKVPDGTYTVTLTARDAWGNDPDTETTRVHVDAVRPELVVDHDPDSGPAMFSPNGDRQGDQVAANFTLSERADVGMIVRNHAGEAVYTRTYDVGAGESKLTWNGKDDNGDAVRDGEYAIELTPVDAATNRGDEDSLPVYVYTALKAEAPAATVFNPGTRSLTPTVRLPFTLKRSARVNWTIVNAAGDTVRTLKADEALAKGQYSFTWDGTDETGATVAAGVYRSVVRATDGKGAARVSAAVTVAPFRVVASDVTPSRKQSVTLTITSAEPLRTKPVITVTEPGRKAVSYRTVKVRTNVYRVTIRLMGSRTGTLTVKITGTTKAGGRNLLRVRYPLD